MKAIINALEKTKSLLSDRKGQRIYHFCVRCFSEEVDESCSNNVKVERIKSRSILSIEGTDSQEFLQDLTTNDITLLDSSGKCIFTVFLNKKGKVLHDVIIYKPEKKDQYLVECDISSLDALRVHMTMYRGRRRVNVQSVEHNTYVWAIYSPDEEEIVNELDLGENVIVCTDPRISKLGLRVIAPVGLDIAKKVSAQGLLNRSNMSIYKALRYKLGVGEGSLEIPYGRYGLMEVNCDFLNGISLKKSHFMGHESVLREGREKRETRLMPLYLDLHANNSFPLNTPIEDLNRKRKTPVGYLRGNQGRVGLGYLNVSEALIEGSLRIGQVLAQCITPPWWPEQNTTIQNMSNK